MANHADFAPRDLDGLRKAYYGASIMPVPVLQRIRRRCPPSASTTASASPRSPRWRPCCAPRSTPTGPTPRPADPLRRGAGRRHRRQRRRRGGTGEIVYRSPQLCDGYWDNPAATEEAFRDGWFHSGDLVRVDEEGYVFVVDRIKDVINTGGVLVASREVEDALYTHPAVAEVAVVGEPDEKWVEAVTAFIVTKADVTESELIEHVRGSSRPSRSPSASSSSRPCRATPPARSSSGSCAETPEKGTSARDPLRWKRAQRHTANSVCRWARSRASVAVVLVAGVVMLADLVVPVRLAHDLGQRH